MNQTVIILLVTCLFLIFALFVYPLFSIIYSIIKNKKVNKSKEFIQPVSIIIASYNEGHFIRDKILSLTDREEWIEGSELIIVSAGSTDNTNKILKKFSNNKDFQIIIKNEHLSKIKAINLAVSRSNNDILVFSDCRQKMKKGSIKNLVHNFNDKNVGTVTSTMMDSKNNTRASIIRKILNNIAITESESGSCLNVYGALYAQRKSLYNIIPTDIIFDDLYVVVTTLVQHKRLIQEKEAIIYDVNFADYYNKERIERLTRGLLLFLFNHKKLLKKLPIGVLLRFLIFKYMKLMLPFLCIIILLCSFYLIIKYLPIHYLLLLAIFLLIALTNKKNREFLLLYMRINFYFLTATLKFIFLNERSISWQKLKLKYK